MSPAALSAGWCQQHRDGLCRDSSGSVGSALAPFVLMVQRRDGFIRGDAAERICYALGAERRRFRGGQRRSPGGTLGATWRLEDNGCAKALHENSPDTTYTAPDVGIGGSGSSPPGAGKEVLLPDVVRVPDGAFLCINLKRRWASLEAASR